MPEMDVYYIVDHYKQSIDRVEMSRVGVVTVRAGVSLLREDQLEQLAAIFGTDMASVTKVLQNPPEPYRYTNSSIEASEMITDFNLLPKSK